MTEKKNTLWNKEDTVKLIELVRKGKSKEYIAEALNRTSVAIEVRVSRLGLQLKRPCRTVKEDELEELRNDWLDGSKSMYSLCKKYNRTKNALKILAQRNHFGPRPYSEEYLSISEICEYAGVSHDTVRNWIKRGLPYKKSKSGRTTYLIDIDDLEKFMKNNQDRFNGARVSESLFYSDPDWLKEKRKHDREYYPTSWHEEYTNEDDKRLEAAFKRGDSVSRMASDFKRTEYSIKNRLSILGYYFQKWNEYELEIIKVLSEFLTVSELHKMLPRRSESGIKYQCEKFKLSYHISKDRCKSCKIEFKEPTDIKEALKFKYGVKPRYSKKGSTCQGEVYCPYCGKCVAHLLFYEGTDRVVGYLFLRCGCDRSPLIDYSKARENL